MVTLEPEILQSVLKPSRYTGGEWNAVVKDADKMACTWALALPDVYEVGMSNLGLAILYEVLNAREDIAAERVYAPWTDMETEMRARDIPLFSLETKREISSFDFLGFSLQYEMIYSNVLYMLDLAGIPFRVADRGEDMPFVVGGGPCVFNVEPVADFFDFFIVGEGEEVILEVSDVFKAWKAEGRPGGRREFLRRLLAVDGIYVPSFYEPVYTESGDFAAMKPLDPAARMPIYKRVVKDMDQSAGVRRPVVPYMDIVLQPRLPILPGGHLLPPGARALGEEPARYGARPRRLHGLQRDEPDLAFVGRLLLPRRARRRPRARLQG